MRRKIMAETKKCPGCYLIKSITKFGKNRSTKDGLTHTCLDCKNKSKANWRKNNYDRVIVRERDWEAARRERVRIGGTKITIHRKNAEKLRHRNSRIVRTISDAFSGKKTHKTTEKTFFDCFGCSSKVFIARFERYFEKNPGMTWQNYGAWHMDHIKPLGSFALNTEADRRLANYYTNLRPVWGTTNIKKSNKYEVEQKI